jgi:hypothetical protein
MLDTISQIDWTERCAAAVFAELKYIGRVLMAFLDKLVISSEERQVLLLPL